MIQPPRPWKDFPANRGVMIQGTSSDAGKTTLVAALCRLFARRGLRIAPFKPQNMALNSAVTPDGGEIGRAQALQAQAARIPPSIWMNPVLLKPASDTGAQVIILGKALQQLEAADYQRYKPKAAEAVFQAYARLTQDYERVVIEGAGSPAEINLREGDIANMGFAESADVPVILVADIDRGGVFAQLVGTLSLLADSEQARVVGFIINKFRGDLSLLTSGLTWLEQRTGRPVLGVLPYLHGLDLAAEDAINHKQNEKASEALLRVVVPVFPRMSNHDDFDPLRQHESIDLHFVMAPNPLPPADVIILPGSKNVRMDLAFLREQGWASQIQRHLRYGGKVLGICGGYQMLGQRILDPTGVEPFSGQELTPGRSSGLGYLPIETTMTGEKILRNVQGKCLLQHEVEAQGYEIHAGRTQHLQSLRPMFHTQSGEPDGAVSDDNQIAGTYWHGLFESPEVITALGRWAGQTLAPCLSNRDRQEAALDRLADAVAEHLDLDRLEALFAP